MATFGKDFTDIKGGQKYEAVLKEIAAKLGTGAVVQVGFFEGATNSETGASIPLYASIQNYGAPSRGIPPRPFMSNMIADKSPGWPRLVEASLKLANYNSEQALDTVGETIAGELRDSITNGGWAPNAPSTLARKKGTQPLIDTGDMLAAVRHVVKST